MALQKNPASRSSTFRWIVSSLLCLLALVIAVVPCSAAMQPTASMMAMPPAAHCAECCPQSTQSVAALCCVAPLPPAQQISLASYALPAPSSNLTTALPTLTMKTDAPSQASASIQLRPPLHPILRI
ncbi:hypothetical protein [Granulicella tundricola]|uniref:Uncharacterized protein n=1 Tax=Granulicella tundricola (strain ATCC BAA-1859 / DSM 23138 / MP5ACTX9) TaxID=1198114 RepID=E8WW69_GRATM|nr:hypothetical protein [Granulicella tundricola]ADW68452.1 hypothetical protein AciX9_1393 [Granulicella tundricola MP5ACTX9]